LVAATTDAIVHEFADDELSSRWELRVVGKGNKVRWVPLVVPVLAALEEYLASRGLPRDPQVCPPGTPLIARLIPEKDRQAGDTGQSITANGLYRAFKNVFAETATAIEPINARAAERLRAASTHWLRHTFATACLAAGGSLKDAQELLGHADIGSTMIYTTQSKDNLHQAAARLSEKAII